MRCSYVSAHFDGVDALLEPVDSLPACDPRLGRLAQGDETLENGRDGVLDGFLAEAG